LSCGHNELPLAACHPTLAVTIVFVGIFVASDFRHDDITIAHMPHDCSVARMAAATVTV